MRVLRRLDSRQALRIVERHRRHRRGLVGSWNPSQQITLPGVALSGSVTACADGQVFSADDAGNALYE